MGDHTYHAMVKRRGHPPSADLMALIQGTMIRSLRSVGCTTAETAKHIVARTNTLHEMDQSDAAALFLAELPRASCPQC